MSETPTEPSYVAQLDAASNPVPLQIDYNLIQVEVREGPHAEHKQA